MGNAYIGVADDYSASVWNPAGLAQMRRLEMMGGISNFGYSNDATFFGAKQNSQTSATSLDNVGFVFPFPTVKGSLVFAFGYNRIADFAAKTTFNGYNDKSSIIYSLYDYDYEYDIPFKVKLTDSIGYSSIQKNVQQTGTLKGGGNLGQWSFAGAIDIEENISFGVSLNVYSGLYDFTRKYTEEDTRNVYNNSSTGLPVDSAHLRFQKFYYDSYISSELNGSNITFGLMYRSDFFRVGLVAKAPSTVKVQESYTNEGQSVFDNTGAWASGAPNTRHSYTANNEYGVQSPWTLGIGASYYVMPELLIAADLEHTDWTQIEWTDSPVLEKDNALLQANFRSVMNYRIGAEVDIPTTELRVRAGYSVTPSPYKNDPSSFDQTMITGGLGIFLQRNVVLDGAVAFGSFRSFRNQYTIPGMVDASRTDESITTTLVNFTVSYRF